MRYVLRWASITAALIFLGILCTLVLGLWRFNRLVRRDVEELLALATTAQGRVSIPMKTSNAVVCLHSLVGLVLLFLPNLFLSDDTSINLPASSSAPSVE